MFKKALILLVFPLLAFTAHKFYISVTNINYTEQEDALQITSRIFIDDLENVLQERYDFNAQLATEHESEMADDYVEKYFRTKFVVKLNGEYVDYTFLGKKYDNDIIICYLELPKIDLPNLTSIEIQNEVLTDLFDEQQNVVHVKIKGTKKSFVLIKENNKGMLNL